MDTGFAHNPDPVGPAAELHTLRAIATILPPPWADGSERDAATRARARSALLGDRAETGRADAALTGPTL